MKLLGKMPAALAGKPAPWADPQFALASVGRWKIDSPAGSGLR
jgi:hypothetical protein